MANNTSGGKINAAIQGGAGEAADFKTQQFGSLVVHAQVQGDYADLQRNNVQWLDANGAGQISVMSANDLEWREAA